MGTLNVVDHTSGGRSGANDSILHAPAPALASSSAAEATALKITIYSSWPSLDEIIPAWEEILCTNSTLSIFSTPEWLGSWWKAFGANRRLAVLAFSDDRGVVIGIAPMYWENSRHSFLGRLKQLRFVGDGSGDSDNLDLILRPGQEEKCVAAFIRWIAQQRNSGVCSLNTLPSNSLGADLLTSQLATSKWPVRQTTTPQAAITFPETWESYIEGLSPKFRRLISRCRRKLESQYQLRLHRCEDVNDIPEMLDVLYSLHQKRWRSVNEPGSFVSAERRDLYARMARAFFDRGWLELWSLELNGRAVAAQISFRYRDRVYGLQEGFDPDFFTHHVGYVLRAGMFEYFIRSGVRVYDFLGGFNSQKQRWGAELGSYTNLQFATPRSLASCSLALDKTAAAGKEWLRHHLPSAAWDLLHRVKVSFIHSNGKESLRYDRSPEVEQTPEGAPIQ